MRDGVFANPRGNGPRRDQAEMHRALVVFVAQRITHPLHCEFRANIGAAHSQGRKPQHRRAVDDPPASLRLHGGQNLADQVELAEKIDLEYRAQRIARQIFHRAGNGIGAIVEQRIEPPAGARKNLGQRSLHPRLVCIIKRQRLKPLIHQPVGVFLLAAGGKHPPAARRQRMRRIIANARRAAGDENGFHRPVIRISVAHGDAVTPAHAPQRSYGRIVLDHTSPPI